MIKLNYTVIIPTLNAAKTIERLLETLSGQSFPPDSILVVDSQSEDRTAELAHAVPGVQVMLVKKDEFDHGGTRDMAIRSTRTPFVVLLTQDALPTDAHWAAHLLAPFEDERVAAVCGRQVAYPDARASEKAVRAFRYPATSRVWDKSQRSTLGMNAFLLSDACAAYRRDAYEAVGGFVHPIQTNEDMLMAAQLLEAGYQLAYCAEAKVWHSHCYSLRQEYRRNRLIGEFLAQYGHRFQGTGELGEGVKMARFVTRELVTGHNIRELPLFWMNCGARLLGNRAGRHCNRSFRSGENRACRQVSEPVEILLAVYNGEAYLREQLDSILNQSDAGWRLTISDDGSTDRSEEIIRTYADAHPDRIVQYKSGLRFGNARDHFFHLMKQCQGKYILFCDQDDVWYADKIKRMRAALMEAEAEWGQETPILVFSDQVPTDADLKPLAPSLMRYQKQYFERFDYRSILMQNVVTGGAMGFNRALAQLGSRYDDSSCIIMHDWWLAAVAARFGRIVYIDEPLGVYRQHGNNSVGAKNVSSISHIAYKVSHTGEIRNLIAEKKKQAKAFQNTFSDRLDADDQEFLSRFLQQRSGPMFYWQYRSEIHGLFRLLGMMALG